MIKSSLLKKLYFDGKEFVTARETEKYCKSLKLDPERAIRNLLKRGYLLRIFKGIYYVRTPDEIMLGRDKYNHLELVAKGMELKGIKKWYFGTSTALKLNNMTHEHFTLDYVINDRLFRAKPVNIAGHKFRFLKIKSDLLAFGIVGKLIRHSDREKTILDIVYISRYNGVPEERIIMDVSEYASGMSERKINEYTRKYPESVRRIIRKVMA